MDETMWYWMWKHGIMPRLKMLEGIDMIDEEQNMQWPLGGGPPTHDPYEEPSEAWNEWHKRRYGDLPLIEDVAEEERLLKLEQQKEIQHFLWTLKAKVATFRIARQRAPKDLPPYVDEHLRRIKALNDLIDSEIRFAELALDGGR